MTVSGLPIWMHVDAVYQDIEHQKWDRFGGKAHQLALAEFEIP